MKINFILIEILYMLYILHTYSCFTSKTKTNTHSHTSSKTNLNSKFTSGLGISFKFDEMARRFRYREGDKNNQNVLAPVVANLNNPNIFWQGWIKFFKFDLEANLEYKPKAFFKNNQFYKQIKEETITQVVNSDDRIKGEFYFYANLFKDTINIMSTKIQSIDNTVEVIDIPTILKSKKEKYDGGIIDRGTHQEGYCLEIVISRPGNKANTDYLICMDSASEKVNFLSKLKELRINYDKDHGLYDTSSSTESEETAAGVFKSQSNANSSPFDGYWVTIQDWTECNLQCGGGESYLQRVCVPPVNGGKACEGEPLLVKKCNTQPCPEDCFLKEDDMSKLKKPLVKVETFMNRPQRYERCKIQESDLLYFTDIEDMSLQNIQAHAPQMVRVVMNNRTISIFSSDDYTSNIASYIIKKTKLKHAAINPYCFTIYDVEFPKKNAGLCAFDFKDADAIKKWQEHFEEFKTTCWTKLEAVSTDTKTDKDEVKKKVNLLKEDISLKTQAKLNEFLNEKKENELELKLKTARTMGFDIIKKEIALEEKIRREEAEREKEEIQNMREECEKAEKKSKIIQEAVKEKESESTHLMKDVLLREEMKQITQNTVDAVSETRKEFIKSMNHMKMKNKIEKFLLKQKLLDIKLKAASSMKDKYKKGDITKCEAIKGDSKKRVSFCKITYHEDPNEYLSCVGENFCIACCNVQFGAALVDEREKCYQKVCNYLSS